MLGPPLGLASLIWEILDPPLKVIDNFEIWAHYKLNWINQWKVGFSIQKAENNSNHDEGSDLFLQTFNAELLNCSHVESKQTLKSFCSNNLFRVDMLIPKENCKLYYRKIIFIQEIEQNNAHLSSSSQSLVSTWVDLQIYELCYISIFKTRTRESCGKLYRPWHKMSKGRCPHPR